MEKVLGTIAAVALMCVGVGLICVTAPMSGEGLETAYPDIQNIKYAGYAIAVFSVALAAASLHFVWEGITRKQWGNGILGIVLAIFAAGTIYGEFAVNHMATGNSAHKEETEQVKALAEYNSAVDRKPLLEKEIADLKFDREYVTTAIESTDKAIISKSQAIMQKYDAYEGIVDGERAKLTLEAMRKFGTWAQGKMTALENEQTTVRAVIAKGKPVAKDMQTVNEYAKYIALGFTLGAVLSFLIGEFMLRQIYAVPKELISDLDDAGDMFEALNDFIGGDGQKVASFAKARAAKAKKRNAA